MDHDFPEITSHTYVAEYKKNTDILLRKILVGNLDKRITSTHLRSFYSAYGCVEECSISPTEWDISCAYITFKNEGDAIRALTENNKVTHYLRVRPAGYYQQPDNLEQLLLTSDALNNIQNSPSNNCNDLWNDIDRPSLNVLNDDCLKHIFSCLPIVDKLRIETVCKRWRGLIPESWSTMRTLDFSPSTWGMSERDIILISSGAFRDVLSKCGEFLREMNLKRDSNLRRGRNLAYSSIPQFFTIDTLSVIGMCCPNLKKFDTTALKMTPRGIHVLMFNCPNLTTIILRSRMNIENIGISLLNFFQRVVKLEHFQISETNFTGKCLLFLPEETMHTFIIDRCSVRDIYLSEALKRLINLRDLRIIDCNNVNKLTMYVINNHCTNLRILKLKYLYQVSMMEFKNTKLTNLEALTIRYNYTLTNDVLLHIVRHCSKLTKINVKDCSVTVEGIRDVQQHYRMPIKFRYFDV